MQPLSVKVQVSLLWLRNVVPDRTGLSVAYSGEIGVTISNLLQPNTIKPRFFFPLTQSPLSETYFQPTQCLHLSRPNLAFPHILGQLHIFQVLSLSLSSGNGLVSHFLFLLLPLFLPHVVCAIPVTHSVSSLVSSSFPPVLMLRSSSCSVEAKECVSSHTDINRGCA